MGHKDEKGVFRGTRERRFQVFPGSALAKTPPAWLFAAQIIDIGGRIWAMMCARIDPLWIESQAAHLVRATARDAHWSRKRGTVIAYEQVTLFGLVLVERRPVTFHRQDPRLAHEIFVREALVRVDIDSRADFVRANARVLEQAHDIESKQRRAGLLARRRRHWPLSSTASCPRRSPTCADSTRGIARPRPVSRPPCAGRLPM